MADENEQEHKSDDQHDGNREHQAHEHGSGAHGHAHGTSYGHQHPHSHAMDHSHDHHHHDHEHGPEHDHTHVHEHGHDHTHEHAHGHSHSHEHKTRFHDPVHAAEFDQRGLSGIRASLTDKLIEMLTLKGGELVLDLATGTGRVARPLSKQLKDGNVVGVDQALAMLNVGHQHKDPIPHYLQSAGEADKLAGPSSFSSS